MAPSLITRATIRRSLLYFLATRHDNGAVRRLDTMDFLSDELDCSHYVGMYPILRLYRYQKPRDGTNQ